MFMLNLSLLGEVSRIIGNCSERILRALCSSWGNLVKRCGKLNLMSVDRKGFDIGCGKVR